jgi:hypothetical protein
LEKLELKTRPAHEQQYTKHYTEIEELNNIDNKKQNCKQYQHMYNGIQYITPTQQRNYTTQKIPRHIIQGVSGEVVNILGGGSMAYSE